MNQVEVRFTADGRSRMGNPFESYTITSHTYLIVPELPGALLVSVLMNRDF
jgi:hypothetical protein